MEPAVLGSTPRVEVVMDSDKSVTAVFTKLTYKWSQKSGPTVSLNEPTSPKPSFSVQNTGTGLYEFELVVGNGDVVSAPDQTSIRVFDVDVIFTNPAIGTNMQIETEQSLLLSISYSGLPVGSEIHAGLWASTIGETPDNPKILTIPQNFKISEENKPNPILAYMMYILSSNSNNLAFLSKTDKSHGIVTATIRFIPPKLNVDYDQVLILMYAYDPTTILFVFPYMVDPLLVYPVSE